MHQGGGGLRALSRCAVCVRVAMGMWVCGLQRVRGDTRDAWRCAGDGRWQSPGAHSDERETAARVDRDASRMTELGTGTVAVAEAYGTAAGERGGLPSGEVDAADAVVGKVLRGIRGAHCDQAAKPMTRCGGGHPRRGCGDACGD
jgi:hypothetical protein